MMTDETKPPTQTVHVDMSWLKDALFGAMNPPEPTDIAAGVAEIQRLLKEAYDHYFATTDGYCKSSEGAVSVHWPTYFDFRAGRNEPTVSVYSYVFGPSRLHDFPNMAAALASVREWHAAEMARPAEESVE
jgi:hypothetical protein